MPSILTVNIEQIRSSLIDTQIVGKVNFEVENPCVVWIKGLNGSGKSTLVSALTGIAFYENSGLIVDGSVCLSNVESGKTIYAEKDPYEFAGHISLLPQRLGGSFMAIHHQDDIVFSAEGGSEQIFTKEILNDPIRLANIMKPTFDNLNIYSFLEKRLGECSYGETRRTEIGCDLIAHESLVILDEPFYGLDKHWSQKVVDEIKRLTEEYKPIWVLTSNVDPSEYGLIPNIEIELNISESRSRAFELIKDKIVESFKSNILKGDIEVEIEDLLIRRTKPREITIRLNSFEAGLGKKTYIIGNNGSGKSTISEMLSGLLFTSKTKGIELSYNLFGNLFEDKISKAPNDITFQVFQNPYRAFLFTDVEQDLLQPNLSDLSRKYYYESFDLLEKGWGSFKRKPITFSFGQLKFLGLLLTPLDRKIIIFDEPKQGLHPSLHVYIDEIIESISRSGRLVVITSCEEQNYEEIDFVYHLRGP